MRSRFRRRGSARLNRQFRDEAQFGHSILFSPGEQARTRGGGTHAGPASRQLDHDAEPGQGLPPFTWRSSTTRPRRAPSRWGRVVWSERRMISADEGTTAGPDVINTTRDATTPPGPTVVVAERGRPVTRQRPANRRSPARRHRVSVGSDRFVLVTQRTRPVAVCHDLTVSPILATWSPGCTTPESDDIVPDSADLGLSLIPPLGSGRAREQSVLLRSCHDERWWVGFAVAG